MINKSQIITLLLLIISIKLFYVHRNKNYKGHYDFHGTYKNVSLTTHDIFKAVIVELIMLLVIGLDSGYSFFDISDPIHSWVGKILAISAGYLIYHELILPYGIYYLIKA